MSKQDVDVEWVRQFQAGNMRAFNLLVLRYQWRLQRVVRRYARNDQEAADIVQDILLKMYRFLPEFRGDSTFYSWLYRIAINTAKNHAQQKKQDVLNEKQYQQNQQEEDNISLDDRVIEDATPEVLLQCKELEKRLGDAIQSLPEDLRTALILREFSGHSYEEVANIMDCPIGTIRSRLARARQQMYDMLKP